MKDIRIVILPMLLSLASAGVSMHYCREYRQLRVYHSFVDSLGVYDNLGYATSCRWPFYSVTTLGVRDGVILSQLSC